MPTEKHDTQVVDDAAAQERETLIDEYAFRGTGQASCIYMAAPWHLVQRAGIDPRSHLGRGLRWLFSLTWPFLGALIVGLVAGGLSAAAILSWAAVAIVFACGTIWEPAAYSDPQAIDVGLLRAMADTQALRVLVARERWWGLVRFALASLGFAVVLAALVVASPWGDWSKVPPGSTFLLAVLYYWVGEMIMFGLFNVGTNRYLADQRYELHAYRPIDSPVIQGSLRNSNALFGTLVIWSMLYLFFALVLIPADSGVLPNFVLMILGACFGLRIAEIASNRWMVSRIVSHEKARRLEELDTQIDALMAQVPDLSPDDERKLRLLRESYDATRDSPTTSAPKTVAGQLARAAIVPTVAFIAMAAAESYVGRVLNKILDRFGG